MIEDRLGLIYEKKLVNVTIRNLIFNGVLVIDEDDVIEDSDEDLFWVIKTKNDFIYFWLKFTIKI